MVMNEPQWQVRIVQDDGEYLRRTTFGYGHTPEEALDQATEQAGTEAAVALDPEGREEILAVLRSRGVDTRRAPVAVTLREILYHGPAEERSRIGYVTHAGDGRFWAYASKSNDDENGYYLREEDTEGDAYLAVEDEFDRMGAFSEEA